MNGFGVSFVTAAVQVTLAALPAAVLVVLAGRRNPRTAAALAATALGLCAVLTAMAFVPTPGWWSWDEWSREPPHSDLRPMIDPPTGGNNYPGGWLFALGRLPHWLPTAGAADTPAWTGMTGWTLLAGLLLTGLAVEAVRLLAGLWTAAAWGRRGRAVDDVGLRRTVDELRAALGCRQAVEVRVSPEIGTAAMVGWRRPVVLLAEDWPAWPEDERRAALAHELAHVRRRDYLVGVLAAACRALHFFNPLVRWLAGRLRRDQELAADALAAEAAGGRATYLRALARMALRQDECWAVGAARPFLSDRDTLLRRVAMLRVTDDGHPLSRVVCWGMAGVLALATLGASAVRGPAQAPKADAEPAVELPPLDLSYVPPDADGLVVIRPAALLARPEMKAVAERWNRLLSAAFQEIGLGADLNVLLDAVEQVAGPVQLKTLSEEERKQHSGGERHALVMGLAMIRMNRDFDWPVALKALSPVMQITETKPGVFEGRCAALGPQPMTLHVLDRRTLVFSLLPGGPVERSTESAERWGAARKKVERAGFAMLLDNRKGRWTESLADNREAAPIVAALGRPAHLAFGLFWRERVAATFAADWAEEPSDADVARGTETIRTALEANLRRKAPEDATDRLVQSLVGEMLRSMKVRREGKVVTAEAESAMRWVDVLQALTPGETREIKP